MTDFEHEVGQITAFSAYGYAAAQLMIAASQRGNANYALRRCSRVAAIGRHVHDARRPVRFNISGDPLIPNIYLYTVGKDGFKFARPASPHRLRVASR